MGRATGLGGVFVSSGDPTALCDWYARRLGVPVKGSGARFSWRDADRPEVLGYSAWSVFREPAGHFAPSTRPFMINLRVDDLDSLLESLRTAGERVDDRVGIGEQGRLGWVMDPDGTRVELWQPARTAQARPEAQVERTVRAFLAAVDAGDAEALASCLDADASVYFPFDDTPGLVEGARAILERFERLFAAWKRRGLSAPYVGFAPQAMKIRPAGEAHALATFTVGIDGAPGRRSVLLRGTSGGWQIVHLHASNLDLNAAEG